MPHVHKQLVFRMPDAHLHSTPCPTPQPLADKCIRDVSQSTIELMDTGAPTQEDFRCHGQFWATLPGNDFAHVQKLPSQLARQGYGVHAGIFAGGKHGKRSRSTTLEKKSSSTASNRCSGSMAALISCWSAYVYCLQAAFANPLSYSRQLTTRWKCQLGNIMLQVQLNVEDVH
jgi:hypothetical protein